jgi:hypothetical protein
MRQLPRILSLVIALSCSCAFAQATEGQGLDNPPESQPIAAPHYYRTPSPVNGSLFTMKLRYYLGSTVSLRNLIEAGFVSGIPNLPDLPTEPRRPASTDIASLTAYKNAMLDFGHAMDTWHDPTEVEGRYVGRRFGVGLATAETRDLLSNLVLPVAFRQIPQYVPADINEGLGHRLGHAAASIVVTHADNGRVVPNISKLGGTVGAAFAAKSFYSHKMDAPELDSTHFVGQYIVFSLAGDLATNMAREAFRSLRRPEIVGTEENGTATESNYYPLSVEGKTFYWLRSAYAPRNIIQGLLLAGYPTIYTMPELPKQPAIHNQAQLLAYDQQLATYGNNIRVWRQDLETDLRYRSRRALAAFGESETQQFLANFLLPVTFRMDPRYIALGPGHSLAHRLVNPLAAIAFSHADSGQHLVNLPLLGGTIGAAAIGRWVYYPAIHEPLLEAESGRHTLDTGRVMTMTIGYNLAADALLNVITEFLGHRQHPTPINGW